MCIGKPRRRLKLTRALVHLVGPDGKLAAQDDHELGRGFYRTFVWQPNEVIRERYTLTVPKDVPDGEYKVRVGA